jgi:hypothetical protein
VAHGRGPIQDYAWTPDSQRLLVVDTAGTVILYDPSGSGPIEAPWTSVDVPDWQRLAPAT